MVITGKQRLDALKSALFIPADRADFIAKAPTRDADAIILDLEDGVSVGNKQMARDAILSASESLAKKNIGVLVRINDDTVQAEQDLRASVNLYTHCIVIPKVETPAQINALSAQLDQLESQQGLPAGHTQILAFIESPTGLQHAFDIANASPRLMGLSLGTEDFSASLNATPNRETLYYPCQKIVFAARAAGIQPLGFAGSIADFNDMDAFANTITLSRDMGFRGACCIHPKQVAVLNSRFSASAEELADAQAIVTLFEEAQLQSKGAIAYKSQMIDAPVYARALAMLNDAN